MTDISKTLYAGGLSLCLPPQPPTSPAPIPPRGVKRRRTHTVLPTCWEAQDFEPYIPHCIVYKIWLEIKYFSLSLSLICSQLCSKFSSSCQVNFTNIFSIKTNHKSRWLGVFDSFLPVEQEQAFSEVVWSNLSTLTLYWSCFLISPPCPPCSSWGSLLQSWTWVPHAGCYEGGKHWTVCLTVMSAICLNTLLVVTNDLSNIGCIPPIFPPSLPQTLRPPRTSRMRSPRPPAVMQRTRERSPPAGRGATSEASKWQNIFEDFKCNDLKTR